MKKKRNIYTFFLILIFFANAVCSLSIGNCTQNRLLVSKASRTFLSKEAVYFAANKGEITFSNICGLLNTDNTVKNISLIQDDEQNNIRKLYIKGNYTAPKLSTGRFFEAGDFADGAKPVAVIGADAYESRVTNTAGILCVKIDGVNFEVIGEMTYQSGINCPLDNMVLINYNADTVDRRSNIFILDSEDSASLDNGFRNVQAHFNQKYPQETHTHEDGEVHETGLPAIEALDIKPESIDRILKDVFSMSLINLLSIFCFVLASITISIEWVNKQRRSIAVKRLIGWSDKKLKREVFQRFLRYAVLSFGAGVVIMLPSLLSSSISPWFILLLFAVNILLTLIVLIPLIKKMLSIPVAEAVR